MVFHIFHMNQFIYVKYFVFCFVMYLIIMMFHNVSHDVYFVFCFVNCFQTFHNVFQLIFRILKKIPQIMMLNSFMIFHNILRDAARKCPTYVVMFISPPLSHCFVKALRLFRTEIEHHFLAAFLPMSALASSSGQFLALLHSA